MRELFECLALNPNSLRGLSEENLRALIKSNYFQLGRFVHPDSSSGNTEQFKKLQESYETLTAFKSLGELVRELNNPKLRSKNDKGSLDSLKEAHSEEVILRELYRLIHRGFGQQDLSLDFKLKNQNGEDFEKFRLFLNWVTGDKLKISFNRLGQISSIERMVRKEIDPTEELLPKGVTRKFIEFRRNSMKLIYYEKAKNDPLLTENLRILTCFNRKEGLSKEDSDFLDIERFKVEKMGISAYEGLDPNRLAAISQGWHKFVLPDTYLLCIHYTSSRPKLIMLGMVIAV